MSLGEDWCEDVVRVFGWSLWAVFLGVRGRAIGAASRLEYPGILLRCQVQAGENDGEFLVSGCQAGAGRFYVVWSVEVVCDPEGSRRMCGRRLLASVGEVRSWMVWSSVSAWVIAVSNSCFDFGCTSWQ